MAGSGGSEKVHGDSKRNERNSQQTKGRRAAGDALAAAIASMAGDPARAAAMGRAGRVAADERFSLPAMLARYEQLYSSQRTDR
jgi:glycosyltransferase involved in cell wall biosynthesis